MSFHSNTKNKKIVNTGSLLNLSCQNPYQSHKQHERTSLFALRASGSMTVEAAVVVPLLLFALTCYLFFFRMMMLQFQIEQALYQAGQELAVKGYVYQNAVGGLADQQEYGAFLSDSAAIFYMKSEVERAAADADYCYNRDYSASSYMGSDQITDLVVSYRVSLPCNIFNLKDPQLIQRVRVKAWTGYEPEQEYNGEEMVFVTERGSVYHRNIGCTHIQLTIQNIDRVQIDASRNEYGAKYYACERCGKKSADSGSVYITTTGNRYHARLTCSGLKRRIRTVPLSETGGLPACSRCGGGS